MDHQLAPAEAGLRVQHDKLPESGGSCSGAERIEGLLALQPLVAVGHVGACEAAAEMTSELLGPDAYAARGLP